MTTTTTTTSASEKLRGIVCALATQYKFPAHQRASVDLQRNLDALNAEVMNWVQNLESQVNGNGESLNSESTAELTDQLYDIGYERLLRKEIGFDNKAHFYLSSSAKDFKLLLSKVISSCLFQSKQLHQLKQLEREKASESVTTQTAEVDQLNQFETDNGGGGQVYYSATETHFTQPICQGVGIWNLVKEAEVQTQFGVEVAESQTEQIETEQQAGSSSGGNDWEEF